MGFREIGFVLAGVVEPSVAAIGFEWEIATSGRLGLSFQAQACGDWVRISEAGRPDRPSNRDDWLRLFRPVAERVEIAGDLRKSN
jgi:hypothetical protein